MMMIDHDQWGLMMIAMWEPLAATNNYHGGEWFQSGWFIYIYTTDKNSDDLHMVYSLWQWVYHINGG